MKPGRNDLCACGSGKKYKNCCLGKDEPLLPNLLATPPAAINHLESLFTAGNYNELENGARLLLEQYPNAGVVWKLYGLSLQMQGKEALSALQRAAELLPNDAEAHGNLAGALRSFGQLNAAVTSGRRAIKIKPDFAEAHNNLGVALQDLGQLEDAVASYRRAIKIKPNFVEAHNNLGGALKELDRLEEAVISYRSAIKIKPDFAKAYGNLGIALGDLGQFDAAMVSFKQALEIDPESYEAIMGMGSERLEAGDMAEAESLFKRALEINPDNLDACLALAQVKKVVADDENFAVLVSRAALVRSGKLTLLPRKKISLHFVLGKCFDDTGDYERAFMHFNEGCKLKRATLAYDPQQTTGYFADVMRIMDRPTIQRLCGGSDPSAVPIFVLGMPRSGTTLTEQIIASHPDVHGAGELPYLLAILQRDVNGEGVVYPYSIPKLQQADLAKWAEDYTSALQRIAPDAQRITDKMPKNFIALGLIHAMLPNAKIIHVNRSPVDTCLSCFTQLFNKEQDHTYDLAELGQYYSDYVRLMDHWRKVLPAGAFLDVQYEDIVADLNKQARHIIAFCGLEWNDACIDFYKNKRSIYTASVMQVRQPIYTSAVERWRNYEKFLGPLFDALGDLAPKRS